MAHSQSANIEKSNTGAHRFQAEQLPESYLTWPGVLDRLGRREELSESQTAWAMSEIMAGRASDVHIAAVAFGLRVKGITAAELAAAAAAMRDYATPVDFSGIKDMVDIVGTGGDGHHTVNISTMSSFLVAATGTPVVKHGNRKASSKCGGADMLESLGLQIERSADEAVRDVKESGFAFLYAKAFHPAMRYASSVRSELKVPTIFNLLGPLTNPAHPKFGLIGCAFREMMPIIGGAFAHQGSRVLVVRGMDGMDEISVCAPTDVVAVDENGDSTELILNPRSLGLNFYEQDALRGGDAEYNAAIARQLFKGQLEGAIKDATLINAAAALATVRGWKEKGLQETIKQLIVEVREVLESGQAWEKLQEIIDR